MSIVSVLVACAFSQSPTVDEWLKAHPKAIDAFRDECRELTLGYVATNQFRLENKLTQAKGRYERLEKVPVRAGASRPNAVKDGVIMSFGSKVLKDKAMAIELTIIKGTEQELKELKELDGYILKPLESLAIDDMGRVEGILVKQVAGDGECMGRLANFDEDVWFSVSTKGVTDGKIFAIPDARVAVVLGTKTYKSVGGGPRTIKHVGFIDLPVKDKETPDVEK